MDRQDVEKQLLPYSFALSIAYLISFTSLAFLWLRRARDFKGDLETSAKVSIICFTLIIVMQATYETI
jgi:hypothetical protein